jgi:hypothetical protein
VYLACTASILERSCNLSETQLSFDYLILTPCSDHVPHHSVPFLSSWKYYLAAGVLSLAVLPYTLLVMLPGINVLLAAATKVDVKGMDVAFGSQESRALEQNIIMWKEQNWFRCISPMFGGLIGIFATLRGLFV